MEAAGKQGGQERKAAAGKRGEEPMERRREEEEKAAAAVAGKRDEEESMERHHEEKEKAAAAAAGKNEERRSSAPKQEEKTAIRWTERSEDDVSYALFPTVKTATTVRGSSSSTNLGFRLCAKIGPEFGDPALSSSHGVLLQGSSTQFGGATFSASGDLPTEFLYAGPSEFGDAGFSASGDLPTEFLYAGPSEFGDAGFSSSGDLPEEYYEDPSDFGNAELSARGAIFTDPSLSASGEATLPTMDQDEVVDLRAEQDGVPSTLNAANVDMPSKKKEKRYRLMEKVSWMFPTAAPPRRVPAREVRSFKHPLIPIEDPHREIITPAVAPPAEFFEDPMAALDAAVDKVTLKKAELLKSEEVTPPKLRKIHRDLKHLALTRKLMKE